MKGTTAEIAQYWANQDGTEGDAGNMSFKGPVLFSYSTPIAIIGYAHKTVFLATYRYSATTSSRHYPKARSATPYNFMKVYPDEVAKYQGSRETYTPEEMLNQNTEKLLTELETMHRIRKYIDGATERFNERCKNLLKAYAAYSITPPFIPVITTGGYLFDSPKDAVKRAQQEVKDHENKI